MVTFYSNLSLKSDAFLLPSADLVSNRANLSLILIVRSILLIQEESEILDFFSERVDRNRILIMSVVIVVILHKFFILNMSVFLLKSVKLISQLEVVLVSLLDLKDLGL